MVFMNDLSNRSELKMISSLLIISLAIFFTPASAVIFIEDGSELDESALLKYLEEPAPAFEEPVVIYFYDPHCGACSPVHDFLDSYLEENPETILEQVSLEEDPEGMDKFREFSDAYKRDKTFIPLMFIGPVGLEGTNEITDYFDMTYNWYMASYKAEVSS
jgi:thiol-disulfide isomerase/thioredoxin